MASGKHRRKQAALDRKRRNGRIGTAAQPGRHPDGDRRRRAFGDRAREALQRKRAVQDWTIDSEMPLDLLPE